MELRKFSNWIHLPHTHIYVLFFYGVWKNYRLRAAPSDSEGERKPNANFWIGLRRDGFYIFCEKIFKSMSNDQNDADDVVADVVKNVAKMVDWWAWITRCKRV